MRIVLFIFFLSLFTNMQSQISRGGIPMWPDNKKSQSAFQLPEQDINRAILSDFSDEDKIKGKKPFRVGVNHQVNLSPENSGEWITLPSGMRVWRLEFYSKGAFGLSVNFDRFKLLEDAIVFLYSPDKKDIIGGLNHFNNKKTGSLSTAFLPGDRIVLELQVPSGKDYGMLNIGDIGHAYVDLFGITKDGSFGDSGDCEIDINCPTGYDWQIIKNAVCRIVFKRNASTTEMCTGTLINTTFQDQRPYVYAANHCLTSAYESGNAVFYFGLESEDCDGIDPFPSGTWIKTISSSELLATSDSLDFSLVRLSEDVPDSYSPYYAGWSISYQPPENSATIHHPQGDVKKISKDYDPALVEYQTTDPPSWLSKGSIPAAFWRIEEWDEGATEGGSSGSPLFNQQKLIVGNLTGGDAQCGHPFNDYFSKFYMNWDYYPDSGRQLNYWLDSLNTGVSNLAGFNPNPQTSINLYLSQNQAYSKMLEWVEKSGYTEMFSDDGLYTFFALPDTSVEKLPSWYVQFLDRAPEYLTRDFLDKFIVLGKYYYSDLLDESGLYSIDDDFLAFQLQDGEIQLNDSLIVVNNERVLSNGIVHPIDVLYASYNNNYKNWGIFPNPNNGEFFIYTDETDLENLVTKVYDRMGKLVKEEFYKDSHSIAFNFSDLSSGLYFVELQKDTFVKHLKIIIVK